MAAAHIVPYAYDEDVSAFFEEDSQTLLSAIESHCDGLLDVFERDIHNPSPIGITLSSFLLMKKVTDVVQRAIGSVIKNYFRDSRLHSSVLRIPQRAQEIVKEVFDRPYCIGSWRPDILFPEDDLTNFVLCEINARFPFNAFYCSHGKNEVISDLPYLRDIPIMPINDLEKIPRMFAGMSC